MGNRKSEDVFRDLDRLGDFLREKPRTIRAIKGRFGIADRTVYRWLERADDYGYEIERVGFRRPTKYKLR